MRTSLATLFFLFAVGSPIYGSHHDRYNLFPNGGVENTFLNQIVVDAGANDPVKGYQTHIEAHKRDKPTFWRLSEGAAVCRDIKHTGELAIQLIRGEKEVRAAVLSNFWRVLDGTMPFGLPLEPKKEITVSFYYKTAGLADVDALKAVIMLGAIKSLPSETDTIPLSPSNEWKLVSKTITLDEMKWGAKVIFTLDAGSEGEVWIDDAFLWQEMNGINLVRNHSFEDDTPSGVLPVGWKIPLEDQWVSWIGAQYRKPIIEEGESVSGNKSLRSTVTYADGSGVSQIIPVHQKEVKPLAFDIWSKLDNSIGKKPPNGYYGPDNYANMTVFVYHYDGTMQEVSPTFCLGESDHNWDYRRFGFRSTKPVKEILLQLTVLGTEPTTSLWVDEIRAWEIGSSKEELEKRGVDYPRLSVSSVWGRPAEQIAADGPAVSNDDGNLYISVPSKDPDGEIFLYLNTRTESKFVNHFRYLFDVIKIDKGGNVFKGITVEKQGYTADGEFEPGDECGIAMIKNEDGYTLTVPYESLRDNPLRSFAPFGFNVLWRKGEKKIYWNGNAANNMEMGRIVLAKQPGVSIKSTQFGKRYYYEEDQSQDFVSQPQLYAGENEAIIALKNEGVEREITLIAGIEGEASSARTLQIRKGEVKTVILPYQGGVEKLADFTISITGAGMPDIKDTFPVEVPPAIEIVPDQEYYFAEDSEAKIEIHNRYRPLQKKGKVVIEVTDLKDGKVIKTLSEKLKEPVNTVTLDISSYRVNPLPVQDYSVRVKYYDNKGIELGKTTKKFGKINHTMRRKLPPIEKLTVDDKGRIVINDDFRFFPIVPSVNIMDWDAAINLGANMYRSYYNQNNLAFSDTKRAWEKNVYTLTIGPLVPEILDQFEKEADSLMSQPGFLACYGKQFYYWNLTPKFVKYRKRVENIIGNLSSPRLLIWGHHDSSFLYDLDMPEWRVPNPLIGYCYVKIMGRPGLGWRNSPFLTRTEMVLNPQRFKLSEVNYYVAFHADEVVPRHFKDILSLRADDWHGVRNESYQAVIDGAGGLYHWVCTQKKDLQRLRGWFQELNYMWPVFVADDAENIVEILPANSALELRLKKWDGKYYLLVANRDELPKTVSLAIDGFDGMKVKKLFELNDALKVKANVISDEWKKYDVHVYEITVDD